MTLTNYHKASVAAFCIIVNFTNFHTVENDYNYTDPACGDLAFICYPTVAPSSLRLYTLYVIRDWNGTFLMTTLKAGRIFHLTLNENGTALAQDPVELFLDVLDKPTSGKVIIKAVDIFSMDEQKILLQ